MTRLAPLLTTGYRLPGDKRAPRPSTGTPRDLETKRLEVDIEYAPEHGARERLVDLVVELLDARRRSGRGSK